MTFEQWWNYNYVSREYDKVKWIAETAWEAALKTQRPLASSEEIDALREANKRLGERQEWWTNRMVEMEEELHELREASIHASHQGP